LDRYKLTIEYEAPDLQQAVRLAENAMDQVPLMDHTLEKRIDMGEDPDVWDPVEDEVSG
jgi:hypothetical protein